MSQFSYSFCLSLFHSLWQSALLLALYAIIQPIVKKQLPSFKRNLLYGLLFSQVVISACTFYIYYNSAFNFYRDIIEANFSVLLIEQQPLVEKYSSWVISIYTLIISFKTIQLLYNWYKFKQLCSTTLIKPSIDLKLFTIRKANEFGICKKVNLWFSDAVSTPLTFGFLKPVILMPVALLNNLSVAEAESLIIHELTHIKNNDYLLNWLLVISETVFFFNPFIRIISGKIRLEREKNCDVQVLQFKYPVISYAETLLKAAKFKTNINFFPIAAVFKNKQLLQRIKFFTVDNNLVFSKRKYNSISFSAIALTLLVNLFILVHIKNHKKLVATETATSPVVARFADQFIPADNKEIPKAISIAAAVQAESSRQLNLEVQELDQQRKRLSVDAKKIAEEALLMANKEREIEFAVIPVVNIEPAADTDEEREFIIKEECSGKSESVTTAYTVKLKNGQWKNELVMVIKEGRPKLDSIRVIKDTIISYIPAMQ